MYKNIVLITKYPTYFMAKLMKICYEGNIVLFGASLYK